MTQWRQIPFAPDYEASPECAVRKIVGRKLLKATVVGGSVRFSLRVDGEMGGHMWSRISVAVFPELTEGHIAMRDGREWLPFPLAPRYMVSDEGRVVDTERMVLMVPRMTGSTLCVQMDQSRPIGKAICETFPTGHQAHEREKARRTEGYQAGADSRALSPGAPQSAGALRMKKWRAANKDKASYFGREWRKANPDAVREKGCTRRARKVGSGGTFTDADVMAKLTAQGCKCYWCAEPLPEDRSKIHADHYIPLARGGSNGPENIVASCPKCNIAKGAMLPEEFLSRKLAA